MFIYNYVICIAFINNKVIKLDASQPFNGFDQLPVSCYNGWGHIINEERPFPVPIFADSLHETSITNVMIFNDDKGKSGGSYKSVLGKSESYNVRKEISQSSEKAYGKKIMTQSGSDIAIENFEIDFDRLTMNCDASGTQQRHTSPHFRSSLGYVKGYEITNAHQRTIIEH